MLRGILSGGIFVFNTIFWCFLLLPFIFLKILLPFRKWRRACTAVMVRLAECWISGNDFNMAVTQNIRWSIQLPSGLSGERSYLVIANHQSWMDIVVIQHVFNRKIPFLRFFLKKELIYVPLLGAAWWALDYPFMRRHSREYLRKHPEKRGEDFKTTLKSVARFKGSSVSILNFLEGTRFTEEKRRRQGVPYRHLLSPKAGGFAFALETMKDELHSILDVTLVYPGGPKSLWRSLCGHLKEVKVHVREIPVPRELFRDSYMQNADTRAGVHRWISDLWKEKDFLMEKISKEG